jgi:phosphate transport system ATP-binding protein
MKFADLLIKCGGVVRLMSDQTQQVKIELQNVTFYYGKFKAIANVSLGLMKNKVTAFIGPSGCGKSTVLRIINRTNEITMSTSIEGKVLIDGIDIYDGIDPVMLRKQVGMVFQKPNPFPKSIYENLAIGPRIHGVKKTEIDHIVEESLKKAALWGEVKNTLHKSALRLSGGQQQRLCIARALTIRPEVLLMDEPCSALDPISTQHIEELIEQLKDDYTIVMVTHNMQQAARTSDYTAFFLVEKTGAPGRLVEFNDTDTIFTKPADKKTEDYINGRFG